MTRRSKTAKSPTALQGISKRKLRWLLFVFTLIFAAITLFLVRWQVLDYDKYQQLASSRFFRKEARALRGDILAADGSVLSYSEPRFDLFVYKDEKQGLIAAENAQRQTRSEFIEKVSQVLEVDETELGKKLDAEGNWLKIADKVTKEKRDQVMSIPTKVDPEVFLDGLSYEESSVRIYPEGQLAAHVVGFIGKDDFGHEVGGAGLEQYFDGVLKPQAGISTVETDSNQNIIAIADNQVREARRGATVKTTIDKNIQAKVEAHLAAAVQNFRAKSGTVIIADPRTGEIIAMANYPTFDPAEYNKVESYKVLGNTAITTPYEIGSVGKIFTMSAAVDQNKVNANTIVINGHKGCQKIIEQRVICTYDKKPQGPLTVTDAMIKSDNLALFATANLIGQDTLADYLVNFGMGQKTGIQLAGEDSGFIKPAREWNEADVATYSFGHSYSQTPLQAVMGVSALANKGRVMEPMIVSELIEADGSKRSYAPKVSRQVMTEKGVNAMADILYQVYLNNLIEGKYKYLSKYKIGMKSGTALIPFVSLSNPINKAGYSEEVNSTYMGYDASDKNTFVMLVNISEPQTTPKLSYNNARFLWLDIFEDVKEDLGVPAVMN
jgi:stage V sporulation protein D (sporulation-specific penicillin-binding protein)